MESLYCTPVTNTVLHVNHTSMPGTWPGIFEYLEVNNNAEIALLYVPPSLTVRLTLPWNPAPS